MHSIANSLINERPRYFSSVMPAYNKVSALFKQYIESLYTVSDSNDSYMLSWQKYALGVGVGLSCLGALYAWTTHQIAMRQMCILCSCIGYAGIRYQGFLESLVVKMHVTTVQTQYRLTCAEVGLDDRRLVLEELSVSRKKQEELAKLIAELTTAVTFFTTLKQMLTEGSYKSVFENMQKQEEAIRRHIDSIEKILQVVQVYFERNNEEVAKGLSEVRHLLEALHQRDLDTVAMLIKIDTTVSHLRDEVGVMIEEIRHNNLRK